MTTQIIVATHKAYRMPSDPLYLPLHVGAALRKPLPYTGDDTGDNISEKNATFCELTGLYWVWKNLDADSIGLCHYRRYFAGHHPGKGLNKWARILNSEEVRTLLSISPLLLPKKRNYLIETGYSQYVHAHHKADLVTTREILSERYPSYVFAFDSTLEKRKGHRFNMFIMRRELLDAYCVWLFDVLFELEARLDISSYSDYNRRVFGFIGERLLDVWIETNHVPYKELPVLHMESQHWLKKGTAFLKRKFLAS
ncbi:MAG: DUF4422 domain-containing protein [Oscillospiraceae bacterium]|nr:DUF4422 domain-containing protein [Oscillospiraceae bacterium]